MFEDIKGSACLWLLYRRGPPANAQELLVEAVTKWTTPAEVEGNRVDAVRVNDHKVFVGGFWIEADAAVGMSELDAKAKVTQPTERKVGVRPALKSLQLLEQLK